MFGYDKDDANWLLCKLAIIATIVGSLIVLWHLLDDDMKTSILLRIFR